ncbi:AAA family ATPase [Mucilaginibacter sp. Bleaf8]|uniref:AAA family ATPase n=1 Tax=Mucilaginibacter sp. Bleaf8 TaxID=2834430 RepID=UPI001BCE482C|nr:AAA family ATPase [Mucilaginibacter sp. Bleaf8]MBS7565812.1 AAA family ATPase [Mucilaginibacter sp. Bleaf8]
MTFRTYLAEPSAERPAEIELIRQMARHPKPAAATVQPYVDPKSAFIMQPANAWLDTAPKGGARRLFGGFWFEHELCILFADTNVGKSILAVQIGQSISSGQPMEPFELQVPAQDVLYFDFELSQRQFEQRYSLDGRDRYRFSDRFYRVVPNPGCVRTQSFASYHEFVSNGLENLLITSKARVLIVDNLSCLRTGTEAAAAALQLMKHLQTLRARYGLSILVLAHTPKRNPARPITRNDLQGSKVLINFCDSAFAIGESQTQPGLRYLKQIKQRSAPEQYGAAQVCLCRILKQYNYLCFDFMGHAHESEHLQAYTQQHRQAIQQKIAELHQLGLSYRQISKRLGIPVTNIARVLKRVDGEGDS